MKDDLVLDFSDIFIRIYLSICLLVENIDDGILSRNTSVNRLGAVPNNVLDGTGPVARLIHSPLHPHSSPECSGTRPRLFPQ